MQTNEGLKVGDYVTVNHRECQGVVYRVTTINVQKYESWCELTPNFGLFGAHMKRGIRHQRMDDIDKIDITRLGLEHLKMLALIENVVKHEAGE